MPTGSYDLLAYGLAASESAIGWGVVFDALNGTVENAKADLSLTLITDRSKVPAI